MKKFNSLILLLVLIGLATSCSQDDSFNLQNSENNRVVISANVGDEAADFPKSGTQTRAASGDLQMPGYSLRYILEVWDESDAVAYREEKLVSDAAQTVVFDFNLPVAGDYDALLWADYVTLGATAASGHYEDLYYKTDDTNGLKTISIINAAYAVSTASRDAFFGKSSFTKTGTAPGNAGSVTLKRPFGRINIIEKDAAIQAELQTMDLAYDVPSMFNVMDGSVSGTSSITLNGITSFPAAPTQKANIFFDYILAPASGQQLLGEIKIDYTLKNTAGTLFTIPANMPVERNKRTNISGNILTDPSMTKLSVEIDDAWTDPDLESDYVTPLLWEDVQSLINGMLPGNTLDLSELPTHLPTTPLFLTISKNITVTAQMDPILGKFGNGTFNVPINGVHFELQDGATITFDKVSFGSSSNASPIVSGTGNVIVRESSLSHTSPINVDGDVWVYGTIAKLLFDNVNHTTEIMASQTIGDGVVASPGIRARNVTLEGGSVAGGFTFGTNSHGGAAIEASGDVTISGGLKEIDGDNLDRSAILGGDAFGDGGMGGSAIVVGGNLTVTGGCFINGGRGAGADSDMPPVTTGGTGGIAIVASGNITLSGTRTTDAAALSSIRVVSGRGGNITGVAIRFTPGATSPRTLTANTAYIRPTTDSTFGYDNGLGGYSASCTIDQQPDDKSILDDCLVGWYNNIQIFSGGWYKITNSFRTYGLLDAAPELP